VASSLAATPSNRFPIERWGAGIRGRGAAAGAYLASDRPKVLGEAPVGL
jgi:hypothetical protein